ncbi:MAG: C4-dicarboxylate ABC transporter substrate-binding protein [Rhizobiales bacterium 17-65-6]|nr:MAG: C4-dicarboxylate ABC transporter substrate-binding protein [Rhizobiales bacterium 12-68-15]OYX90168.1 MAG: C4-dicarboxylate ABC transporter substrate-binding protein [Azorhizobium sp. 32-67-21]OZA00258.1 MAG: C4-dicarboxylate ABC transporter substrate-binding protein [Rhizobiales bacterium 17-65-6]
MSRIASRIFSETPVSRRLFTALGLALLAAPAGLSPAAAQMSDLKIMAPAAPGGGWDQTARSMQQAIVAANLARSVQVTNVGGAGGTIGIAQLVNGAKGDGNQLMVMGYVMVGAILTNKAPVTLEQVTPIARLTEETEAIAVPANSPLKTVQELADAIKANPAKVTWAGGSAGGVDHIAAALFAKAAGADPAKINYIPFAGGGEALAAVLGGKVTAGISGYGEFDSQVKAGKLRILAVTAKTRVPGVDAPTLTEAGLPLSITNWRGVVAPPGITAEQRAALTGLVEKMAQSPAWQDILKQKGWDGALMTGPAFDAFLKEENVRTTDILKSVGLVKP